MDVKRDKLYTVIGCCCSPRPFSLIATEPPFYSPTFALSSPSLLLLQPQSKIKQRCWPHSLCWRCLRSQERSQLFLTPQDLQLSSPTKLTVLLRSPFKLSKSTQLRSSWDSMNLVWQKGGRILIVETCTSRLH